MRSFLFLALIAATTLPARVFAQTDSARWAPFIATADSLRLVVGVPGLSYAIVDRGRLVSAGGLGYSDVASKTPATATTLYPVASLTKTIAAVTLFQLVEAGKLDLDQRMSVVLANYRFNPRTLGYAARCDVIAMLGASDDPEFARYRPLFQDYRCQTEPITVRHHLTHMAQGVPGSAYRYNGFLYGMLAPVAEAASGKSFRVLVRDGVLVPAGMETTTFSPEEGEPPLPGVAQSYRRDSTGVVAPSACQDCYGLNAGSGIVSSAPDLARFVIALDAGKLVSDSLRRAMYTPARTRSGARSPYANGWFVEERNGQTLRWHYGWLPDAYSGLMLVIPGRDVALILLANSDGLSAGFDLDDGDVLRSPFARAFVAAVPGR